MMPTATTRPANPICAGCGLHKGIGFYNADGAVGEPDPAPDDPGEWFDCDDGEEVWVCTDECADFIEEERGIVLVRFIDGDTDEDELPDDADNDCDDDDDEDCDDTDYDGDGYDDGPMSQAQLMALLEGAPIAEVAAMRGPDYADDDGDGHDDEVADG